MNLWQHKVLIPSKDLRNSARNPSNVLWAIAPSYQFLPQTKRLQPERWPGHTFKHLTGSCKLVWSLFQCDCSSEESDPTEATQPWLHYLLKGMCCCSCCCCCCGSIVSVRATLWQHEELIGTRKKFESTGARQKIHAWLTERATLCHDVFTSCIMQTLFIKSWLAFSGDNQLTETSSGRLIRIYHHELNLGSNLFVHFNFPCHLQLNHSAGQITDCDEVVF